MKIRISKNIWYQILFVLCVAVPYLNNYELTFAVWTIAVILTIQNKYSYRFLYQILCFSGILVIAFASSFYQEFLWYNYFRDVAYLLKPIIGFFIGYQLCRKLPVNPFRLIINTGVILAVIHILIVVYGYFFFGYRNVHMLRYYSGYFSDFEIYAIIILVFNQQFDVTFSKKAKQVLLMILIISSAFYMSRTNFIQFGILYIAMKGYLTLDKRTFKALGIFTAVTLILYSAVLYYNPKRNGEGIEAFLYKVKIAPTEAFKSKINMDDYRDFHDNYRSYENILTQKQLATDGTTTVMIGKGLGSNIDLKKEVRLEGTMMRYIPVLHNGFMTVYLKSGLLGVLLLLVSIFLLFKIPKSDDKMIKNTRYLLHGTAVFLFLSYWVFMGFYFKADTKVILIGLLLAYIERENRKLLIKEDQKNDHVNN